MGARGWSGGRGPDLGAVVERDCWPMPGLLFELGGVSPCRGGAGGGGNLRRRLVVSDSVSVGTVGRQGATGGWWVGRGGRSGQGRGGVGARPTGGASGNRAEGGGGGGAMGSVPSWEGARRCGKRGGPANLAGFGVGAGAAGAPGGVEPDDIGSEAVPGVRVPSSRPVRGSGEGGGAQGAPGVGPDVLAASPVAAPLWAIPAVPDVPATPRVSSAVSPVPSVTGGSVGDGGVAGRGGMEARRASVLMHPPFPSYRRGAGGVRAARDAAVPGTYTRAGVHPSGRVPPRAVAPPRVKRHSTG